MHDGWSALPEGDGLAMTDPTPFPSAAEQADVMQGSNGGCYDFAFDGYEELWPGEMKQESAGSVCTGSVGAERSRGGEGIWALPAGVVAPQPQQQSQPFFRPPCVPQQRQQQQQQQKASFAAVPAVASRSLSASPSAPASARLSPSPLGFVDGAAAALSRLTPDLPPAGSLPSGEALLRLPGPLPLCGAADDFDAAKNGMVSADASASVSASAGAFAPAFGLASTAPSLASTAPGLASTAPGLAPSRPADLAIDPPALPPVPMPPTSAAVAARSNPSSNSCEGPYGASETFARALQAFDSPQAVEERRRAEQAALGAAPLPLPSMAVVDAMLSKVYENSAEGPSAAQDASAAAKAKAARAPSTTSTSLLGSPTIRAGVHASASQAFPPPSFVSGDEDDGLETPCTLPVAGASPRSSVPPGPGVSPRTGLPVGVALSPRAAPLAESSHADAFSARQAVRTVDCAVVDASASPDVSPGRSEGGWWPAQAGAAVQPPIGPSLAAAPPQQQPWSTQASFIGGWAAAPTLQPPRPWDSQQQQQQQQQQGRGRVYPPPPTPWQRGAAPRAYAHCSQGVPPPAYVSALPPAARRQTEWEPANPEASYRSWDAPPRRVWPEVGGPGAPYEALGSARTAGVPGSPASGGAPWSPAWSAPAPAVTAPHAPVPLFDAAGRKRVRSEPTGCAPRAPSQSGWGGAVAPGDGARSRGPAEAYMGGAACQASSASYVAAPPRSAPAAVLPNGAPGDIGTRCRPGGGPSYLVPPGYVRYLPSSGTSDRARQQARSGAQFQGAYVTRPQGQGQGQAEPGAYGPPSYAGPSYAAANNGPTWSASGAAAAAGAGVGAGQSAAPLSKPGWSTPAGSREASPAKSPLGRRPSASISGHAMAPDTPADEEVTRAPRVPSISSTGSRRLGSGTARGNAKRALVMPDGASPKKLQKATKRGRRTTCVNCGAHQTPQWRCGPYGPRTLCNACGVRYKKGLPLQCWPPPVEEIPERDAADAKTPAGAPALPPVAPAAPRPPAALAPGPPAAPPAALPPAVREASQTVVKQDPGLTPPAGTLAAASVVAVAQVSHAVAAGAP